jgi:predicted RNase H-like HicB family nuclease
MSGKKDRYIYPAIFDFAEDGISVEFPDLPGCLTCGDNQEEAFRMAKEAMALHLYGMEEESWPIPEPSPVTQLQSEQNQVIVLIEAFMFGFRREMEQQSVKKTLTIPKWLNKIAEDEDVNFSQILQDALKERLGLNEHKYHV